jgi:phosphoenolpyruvate carboxykinase (GTP)
MYFFLLGFGENTRVLDWIFRRCDGQEDIATSSPIGYLPSNDSLNLEGLGKIEMNELMSVPKEYWLEEVQAIRKYFSDQLSSDIPSEITQELNELERRVEEQS